MKKKLRAQKKIESKKDGIPIKRTSFAIDKTQKFIEK